MRFFLATLFQETNSFCPRLTDLALFARGKLAAGGEAAEQVAGANLEMAGFAEGLRRSRPDAEIVWGSLAWGVASGPMRDECWIELLGRLRRELEVAGPLDGVLISLHGATMAETCADCAGEILAQIRAIVGGGTAVVATLDLHAIVTPRMLALADRLVGYETYPHVDMAETGHRAVVALLGILESRRKVVVARRWPAVVPVDNAQTDSGPLQALVDEIKSWPVRGLAETASVFMPHPWIDTPDHGVTVVAYSRAGAEDEITARMMHALTALHARRAELLVTCPSAEEFLTSWKTYRRPIAAIDAGDITTAGGVGDSTTLLRIALGLADAPSLLVPVVDPGAVERLWLAGENEEVEVVLGEHNAAGSYHSPVVVRGLVRSRSDASIELRGAAFAGMKIELGRRALLQCGRVSILLLSQGGHLHDPQLWRTLGVEPAEADVVVQKSHKLFRPGYAEIVRDIVTVDTGGCTDRNIARLPYHRVSRRIFPFDRDFEPSFLSL